MGVKSTVRITRADAEERFVAFKEKRSRLAFQQEAQRLDNEQLESVLERWNDHAHNGEGFENYIITENPENTL